MKHSLYTFHSFLCLAAGLLVGMVTLTSSVRAQSATQTITLTAGWNAVWLEVEPVDGAGQRQAPDVVFSDPSILTIASPKPLAGLSEFFAGDPGTITTFNQDEWQQWKQDDPTGDNNLSLIDGNRPYLIRVASDKSAFSLNLTGKVRFFNHSWVPDRYNLVGFGLQGSPSFSTFFGPSGNTHPVAKIFTLDAATGNWLTVSGAAPMTSGKAYWVFCSGPSNYMGPVSVSFDRATNGTLNFGDPTDFVKVGTGLDELDLDLEELVFSNAGTASATPELDLITPDSAPGSLALYVVNPNPANANYLRGNQVDSSAGSGASAALDKSVASLQTTILTLGAKRNWTGDAPRTNTYRLKTGLNSASFWLPITAVRSLLAQTSGAPGTPASEVSGLWVGDVIVNSSTSIVEDGAPVPPAGSAPRRIILHAKSSGGPDAVHLLSQVTAMQTKTADPALPNEPVLVVDPAKISIFEGIKERNGKRVGLRIEAVTYDMPRKLDGVSQGDLIGGPTASGDPKFLKLTSLPANLQAALSDDPSIRTPAQITLISSSAALITAAKSTIPTLLPNYLLSSGGRPPKLVEAYGLTAPMTGSLGAGQTVEASFLLDPFHRSNPFRHAFHHDLSKGPQISRVLKVEFDADQPIADVLRGTCTEEITGLIQSKLTLSGRIELRRISTVDTLN